MSEEKVKFFDRRLWRINAGPVLIDLRRGSDGDYVFMAVSLLFAFIAYEVIYILSGSYWLVLAAFIGTLGYIGWYLFFAGILSYDGLTYDNGGVDVLLKNVKSYFEDEVDREKQRRKVEELGTGYKSVNKRQGYY